MTIIAAMKTGKPFKRPFHQDYIIIDPRAGGFFAYAGKLKYAEEPELKPSDILAEDWTVKS